MDKTARQEPFLQFLQNIAPSVYPIIRRAWGTREMQIGDYEGRMPTPLLGVFNIGKLIPEFGTREEVEKLYEDLGEKQEEFRRALTYNINRNVFNMDQRAAWEHAKNKFTAGSASALLLMKAGGADQILKNLERASMSAGLSPSSVGGLKAKARNQKISQLMVNLYSHIINPDNLGKMGNLDALEASTLIGPAIRSGMLNGVLDNPQAWGNNYQLRPEYNKRLRNNISTLGQGISAAKDSGLVSGDPRQAWGKLTQLFGQDPIVSLGVENFKDAMQNMDYGRRAAGMTKEEMAQLLPTAIADVRKSGGSGLQALGHVNAFLAMRKAGTGAYAKNVDPRAYNKNIMGFISREQPMQEIISATGAGLESAGLSKNRIDEVLHSVMSNPYNLRDASRFVSEVGERSGVRMSLDNLKHLKNTPEAMRYRARGDYVVPLMKIYREDMMEDLHKALSEPDYHYVLQHLNSMGGPLDANLKKITNMYRNPRSEGINTGDIAYGKLVNRMDKVFQRYGMDYHQGQRFLQSVPGGNVGRDLDPHSPSSQVQSSQYLDNYFKEMEKRRRMPDKVKQPEYAGGTRGATQWAWRGDPLDKLPSALAGTTPEVSL